MSCCILAATDANAGKSLVSSHTDSVINTIKVFNIDGGEPGISNLGNRSDLTPRQDSIRPWWKLSITTSSVICRTPKHPHSCS